MADVVIHNGEIIVDGRPQVVEEPKAPGQAPGELHPDEIAFAMAGAISSALEEKLLPMEIVNKLLTLQIRGQKAVWTKWDIRQLFALWSKKIEGAVKL